MARGRTPRPAAIGAAAVLYVFLGLAFGISVPFVLGFLAENGYLPMTFGFESGSRLIRSPSVLASDSR